MPITKEKLLNEIKNLKQQEENLMAEATAARGAYLAYEYLVSELEKEEKAIENPKLEEKSNDSTI